MKIVFIMRHSGYVRNFESTLRMLCERGHQVHLAYQVPTRDWLVGHTDIARGLATEFANFTVGDLPVRNDGWGLLGRDVRLGLDYLRYLTPEFREAPKLRRRAERDLPPALGRLMQRAPFRSRVGRALLTRSLKSVDRAIPRRPAIDAFFAEHSPDVLLVTPLIEPGSPQADYIRSARARGVRTVFCVASWDNLTNKGLIHDPVDLVTVWNEPMKREAMELHRVPADRIVVTGAQPFDHWFDWRPSRDRATFVSQVGLPVESPYLLYLCSSKFVAPNEAAFVRKWLMQLRAQSGRLGHVGVLVRPHPQNAEQWRHDSLADLGSVRVWPSAGAAPVDVQTRADYFDSIYHSAAVVGVNTTAEIESAIIGRRVYTVLDPEFKETQEGTLHFQHLRDVNGGLLNVASSFEEHLAQLAEAVQNPQSADQRCRRFVEAFVRPYGITEPATPRLVDAIEKLGAQRAPRPVQSAAWTRVSRRLLRPLAQRVERQASSAAKAKADRVRAKSHARKLRAVKAAAKKSDVERKTSEQAAKKKVAILKNNPAPESPVPAPGVAETELTQSPSSVPVAIPAVTISTLPGAAAAGATAAPIMRKKAYRVVDLVQAFQALSHADRVRFVSDSVEHIPAELWVKMQSWKADRLDYPHADIYLRVTSKAERKRLRACAKEPFTVDWIDKTIRAGEVFFDIGANVGAYSLIAAKKPTGAARVFAFEPSFANVSALCNNVVLNKLTDEITPLAIALSNGNALKKFNLRELEPGSAKHMLEADSPDGPTLYAQPVITYRLDDLVTMLSLPLPNHIKLDVDGGEMEVLEGATRTLDSPTLRTMLVEVSTDLSERVTDFIEAKGLKLFSRVNVRAKSGEYRVWYGLFARDTAGLSPITASNRPGVVVE